MHSYKAKILRFDSKGIAKLFITQISQKKVVHLRHKFGEKTVAMTSTNSALKKFQLVFIILKIFRSPIKITPIINNL